ncbi:hypothetical protein AOQ84DRAFT_380084, partial [Glonium stellatum]
DGGEEEGMEGVEDGEEEDEDEEEGEEEAGAGPTAVVRPRVAARALVLDEEYGDEEGEEDEAVTYEGVIVIPSDDEVIVLSD